MSGGRFDCLDCGVDTFEAGEYFRVRDDVWRSAGFGPHDGMACIGCLEARLQRVLTARDFPAVHVNTGRMWPHSDRLRSRLAA